MAATPQEPPRDDTPHPAEERTAGTVLAKFEEPRTAVSRANETASSVLAAQARAEIEARTFLALTRPRDVNQFRINVLQACRRPRFAGRARYAKPVGGGKKVVGLSIRFAEECARQYTNLDITSMVVTEDDERRVIRVRCTDLEANVTWSQDVVVEKTVERRAPRDGDEIVSKRVNSTGQPVYRIRAEDDALLVKQNALISKAARNLILDHLPSDIIEEAEDTILDTVRDEDAKDPTAARKRMVDAFYNAGVTPAQLEAHLGHKIDLTTSAEMQPLRTILNGILEGESTWAELSGAAKPATADVPSAKSASDRLRTTAAARPHEEPSKAPEKNAGTVCEKCGATDGKHDVDCPRFAD